MSLHCEIQKNSPWLLNWEAQWAEDSVVGYTWRSPLIRILWNQEIIIFGIHLRLSTSSLTHCGLVMPWRHRSWSTMVQVMACCLTAPSHYLIQYWLLVREVLWHSPESNFTMSDQVTILYNEFENHTFKIIATPPRGHSLWLSNAVQHHRSYNHHPGSGTGLLPVRHQAITWTTVYLCQLFQLNHWWQTSEKFQLKLKHCNLSH